MHTCNQFASIVIIYQGAPPMAQRVKNPPAVQETQETWVQFLDWEDPLKRKWQSTAVFLPGKFHGQRSLAGSSPRDHIESDMTKHTALTPMIAILS